MFDFKRTLALIKGAIFDPETTWDGYLPEAGDWKKTAVLLTGPLVVASGLLAYLVDLVFPNRTPFIPDTGFLQMLIQIVMAAVAAVVVAFIFAFLAGLFKGKNSFALGLAATSLAFVPGYVGNVFVHVPWIGWLLSLALGIYGLVLLWRILPRYLEVPAGSRIGHYILSLVTCIVAFFILGMVFGAGMMGSRSSGFDISSSGDESTSVSSGMFAGLERQGKIMEAAQGDEFDPPGNGRLTESQVRGFVAVLSKTRQYRDLQAQRLEKLSEKAEQNEIASVGEALSGMAGVMNISNAEMEVVKTGGGNWAEHQWIREQLHVARIQKDINSAVAHNYQLYLAYEDELAAAGF